jgi:hypothetical protein
VAFENGKMQQGSRHIRARVRGRYLELLEDLDLPDGQDVTVTVAPPEANDQDRLNTALAASAGAWSDEAHPDLMTREDVVLAVADGRARLDRGHGR